MKNSKLLLFLFSLLVVAPAHGRETEFKKAPAPFDKLVYSKLPPTVSISGDNQWMLQLDRASFRPNKRLAQPEIDLAEVRFNPETFHSNRSVSYFEKATLIKIADKTTRVVAGLPEGPSVAGFAWSQDNKKLLLAVEETDGVYPYVVNVADAKAVKLTGRRMNCTSGVKMKWLNNDEICVLLVPVGVGVAAPQEALAGPVVYNSSTKPAPSRTYPHIIDNKYEEGLFTNYFTSKLARISVPGGEVTEFGEAVYHNIDPSPDGKYILTATLSAPSYYFTFGRIGRTYTIVDTAGKEVLTLKDPSSNRTASDEANPTGYSWRNDKPATIYWNEPQTKEMNGGEKPEFNNHIYQMDAPFTAERKLVFQTKGKYDRIDWCDDEMALIRETYASTRTAKIWKFNPGDPASGQEILENSTNGKYANPGTPVKVRNQYGENVVWTNPDHSEILFTGDGASPKGDMPFLSRYDMKKKKTTVLWQCEAPYYERVVRVTDPAQGLFITSRESVDEQPNYYSREAKKKGSTQITFFPHPYPELKGITAERINYKREDGILLSAMVYLPPGYDKKSGNRLPVLMWAYPREYKTKEAASEVRGSDYSFTRFTHTAAHAFVMRNYCVMTDVEMPIVGLDKTQPNNNYIKDLQMNAKAAVEAIHKMGVGDTTRVAVGGHSYGAFMTANLLTHTPYFKAGIARSGAFNRTLTPFGFQSEKRDYWQAMNVYDEMSPFRYANKIKAPILLIHGNMDENSGTWFMQSQRYFQALRGLGKTARFVVLPYEKHVYQGEENVMQVFYETDRWLEQYVKNPKPAKKK